MGGDWSNVKFTLAEQVARLGTLSERAAALLAPGDSPAAFFAKLRAEGAVDDALIFVAQALPRLQAVRWACDCAREGGHARGPADEEALAAAAAWLRDPSEELRRAAQSAAERAEFKSAEAFAALAAFWSGGSIAPAQSPHAVPAPPNLCGKAAYAAAALAATRGEPRSIGERKDRFLDAAQRLAGAPAN